MIAGNIFLAEFSIFFLITTVFSRTLTRKNDTENNCPCSTVSCVETAFSVIHSMNVMVDPCDDFYTFACGNFFRKTQIDEKMGLIDAFSWTQHLVYERMKEEFLKNITGDEIRPFRLVKQYYRSCLHGKHITVKDVMIVSEIVRSLGGWPVLEEDRWEENNFNWTDTQKNMRQLGLHYELFLNINVEIDSRNTSRRIIVIGNGFLNLEREILIQGWKREEVKNYLSALMNLTLANGADEAVAHRDMTDVINLEIDIAKIIPSKVEERDIFKNYQVLTIAELTRKFEYVPWLDHLQAVLDIDNITLTEDEEVAVLSLTYLENLGKLLNNYTKRTQANYMITSILTQTNPPSEDEKLRPNFYAKFDNVEEQKESWFECMLMALAGFQQAAGALYVRNVFNRNSTDEASKIVQNIRNSFLNRLKELEWMDDSTREQAIAKAKAMIANVGYPQEFLDDKVLEDFYSDLTIHDNATLLESNLYLSKFLKDKKFQKLRDFPNRSHWEDHTSVLDVNAYYIPNRNVFNLPAALLQGVYFSSNKPHFMNYGALGFIVGHEITHGFDDVGSQFDKDGNLRDWWQERTGEKFLEKAQCIVDQYGNYTDPEVNLPLNGLIMQGESIADDGALRYAYAAYQNWVEEAGEEEKPLPGLNYTSNQMFWISAANMWCTKYSKKFLEKIILTNEHPPARYRIVGPFSNNELFSKDFNCPLNSKMNPNKKCDVW